LEFDVVDFDGKQVFVTGTGSYQFVLAVLLDAWLCLLFLVVFL
jgi:hypothetical protein